VNGSPYGGRAHPPSFSEAEEKKATIRGPIWLLLLIVAVLVPALSSSAAVTPCKWAAVPNPAAPSSSYLNDIVPISADDAWAVGRLHRALERHGLA
jgi:hypothetical protein